MKSHFSGSVEAAIELLHFKQKLEETGIAKHLSNTAVVLLFIALGRKAWR